ncbi:hypothetical protein BC826DRAFT_1006514 [Russula brevipes]|nr:hypothetical protein BC826DRAFT_1006514 [Russula brevipes]
MRCRPSCNRLQLNTPTCNTPFSPQPPLQRLSHRDTVSPTATPRPPPQHRAPTATPCTYQQPV